MAKSNKPSMLEKARRIRICQEWIMSDYSWTDIITNAINNWAVSKPTAERYYSEAFKSFKDTLIKDVENRKAYYIQKKKRLIKEMDAASKKTPAGVRAINQVLDSMAMLEGIVIQKVEVSGAGGGPIPTEITIKHVKVDAPPFASSEGEVQI